MTTPRDFERRLAEHFRGEAQRRAPDWILPSALTTIETTRQRRGLTALRRNSNMPNYAKLAAAAVVVIAVGAFALIRFTPPGPGGPSIPAPTTTASPTPFADIAAVADPDDLCRPGADGIVHVEPARPFGLVPDRLDRAGRNGAAGPTPQLFNFQDPVAGLPLRPRSGLDHLFLAARSHSHSAARRSTDWLDRPPSRSEGCVDDVGGRGQSKARIVHEPLRAGDRPRRRKRGRGYAFICSTRASDEVEPPRALNSERPGSSRSSRTVQLDARERHRRGTDGVALNVDCKEPRRPGLRRRWPARAFDHCRSTISRNRADGGLIDDRHAHEGRRQPVRRPHQQGRLQGGQGLPAPERRRPRRVLGRKRQAGRPLFPGALGLHPDRLRRPRDGRSRSDQLRPPPERHHARRDGRRSARTARSPSTSTDTATASRTSPSASTTRPRPGARRRPAARPPRSSPSSSTAARMASSAEARSGRTARFATRSSIAATTTASSRPATGA